MNRIDLVIKTYIIKIKFYIKLNILVCQLMKTIKETLYYLLLRIHFSQFKFGL